jgi:hypothetical protein
MFLGLVGDAAKEIAAANDDGHLDAEIVDIGKFGRDFMNARGVDAEALIGGEGFAGDFQQNAFEDGSSMKKADPSLPHPRITNCGRLGAPAAQDDNRLQGSINQKGRRSAPELYSAATWQPARPPRRPRPAWC